MGTSIAGATRSFTEGALTRAERSQSAAKLTVARKRAEGQRKEPFIEATRAIGLSADGIAWTAHRLRQIA